MASRATKSSRSKRNQPRVIAVTAAYNEADNIALVVRRAVDLGYEIIVVDDGSEDDTAQVARNNGAVVLRHPTNFGQGQGLLTGFKAAIMEECDYIVEMDADCQHDPADIPRFIDVLEASDYDIVVGSRVTGANHPDAPLMRRLFLPYVTAAVNMLTGYRMSDAMCGYRAFRTEGLRRARHVLDEILEPQYIAAEMFVRFSRAGLTVGEIPIALNDRGAGASHKGTVRYGFGVMKAIMRGFAR